MDENTSPATRRWVTIFVIAAVLAAVWLILRPLAEPIVWALILAFLLYPLHQRLTRRLGNSPRASAGIITGLTPVAIFVPLVLLAIAFANQISGITTSIAGGGGLFDVSAWIDPDRHPRIAGWAESIAARFNMRLTDLREYLQQSAGEYGSAIARSSGALFLGTAMVVLQFFVMLFILYFALRDGALWFARAAELLPLERRRRNALLTRLGKVLRAVVYGCGLTALVQGALVAVGFAAAGLPGYVVFGVLAALCGLLPFGGAAIVWLPGALYLLADGHPGWGVFMLAWGGIVSTSDNFIRPWIIKRYTPVPTLVVFLGVIGGVSAFGFLGFILGPLILVLAVELLRFAERSYSRRH